MVGRRRSGVPYTDALSARAVGRCSSRASGALATVLGRTTIGGCALGRVLSGMGGRPAESSPPFNPDYRHRPARSGGQSRLTLSSTAGTGRGAEVSRRCPCPWSGHSAGGRGFPTVGEGEHTPQRVGGLYQFLPVPGVAPLAAAGHRKREQSPWLPESDREPPPCSGSAYPAPSNFCCCSALATIPASTWRNFGGHPPGSGEAAASQPPVATLQLLDGLAGSYPKRPVGSVRPTRRSRGRCWTPATPLRAPPASREHLGVIGVQHVQGALPSRVRRF